MTHQGMAPTVVKPRYPALSNEAIYAGPSGRMCRLVAVSDTDAPSRQFATFQYLPARGAPALMAEQFALAARNWHLLRRVD